MTKPDEPKVSSLWAEETILESLKALRKQRESFIKRLRLMLSEKPYKNTGVQKGDKKCQP
jgi:hypothetical protein